MTSQAVQQTASLPLGHTHLPYEEHTTLYTNRGYKENMTAGKTGGIQSGESKKGRRRVHIEVKTMRNIRGLLRVIELDLEGFITCRV